MAEALLSIVCAGNRLCWLGQGSMQVDEYSDMYVPYLARPRYLFSGTIV